MDVTVGHFPPVVNEAIGTLSNRQVRPALIDHCDERRSVGRHIPAHL